MTDKLQDAIRRADIARDLMENELLQNAFVKLEQDYVAAWQMTRPAEVQAREKLWLAINMVGKVRSHLGQVLADGKIARLDLNDRARKAA